MTFPRRVTYAPLEPPIRLRSAPPIVPMLLAIVLLAAGGVILIGAALQYAASASGFR